MENGKETYVSINATTRCDRGCLHCSFESTPIGIDFTAEKAKKVRDLINNSDLQTIICLTGGGEPLLNHDLSEIVKVLAASKMVRRINLVTSGFKTHDERKLLKKTIKMGREKIMVVISFHIFAKDHLERITETIRYLLQLKNSYLRAFEVKTTVALKKKENTLGVLHRIFNKFDIYSYLVQMWPEERIVDLPRFESKIYSEKKEEFLFGLAHFFNCTYWQEDSDRWVIVNIQPLSSIGRAKNLSKNQHHFEDHCPTMTEPDNFKIKIDANGNVYPASCCHSKAYPNLAIATIDDEWQTIYARRKRFAEQTLKMLLADKSMYDHPNNICSLCAKIKAELDARA